MHSTTQTARTLLAALVTAGAVAIGAQSAFAAAGDCGQPFSTGDEPSTADCLFSLRAALELERCRPECICDTNGDEGVSATDALLCLRFVVGAEEELFCDCPTGSSTTSTTESPPTTTVPGSTSTLPTTSSTVTTSTLGPTSQCPSAIDVRVLPRVGAPCASNADCASGLCSASNARCAATSELDIGSTGLGHDSDVDEVVIAAGLVCPGDAPACGECAITGTAVSARTCRCEDDHRRVCDAPFAPDFDDCGGDNCVCYLAPPFALSAGNTPTCVVNELVRAIGGTVDPDSGALALDLAVRALVHSGLSTTAPCPSCGGRCTAPEPRLNHACLTNADCDFEDQLGLCEQYDTVPGDGVREGLCFGGPDEGFACDPTAYNGSFPAPTGGATSLDCFPDVGTRRGTGLRIDVHPTTGAQALGSAVPCGFQPAAPRTCPCGTCSDDPEQACSSDADCLAPATCTAPPGKMPNECTDELCATDELTEGACTNGPLDRFCDGLLKADGAGLFACSSNADCEPANIGVDAGICSLARSRECFPTDLTSTGEADPLHPVAAGLFCIPQAQAAGLDSVFGFPGPARVRMHTALATFCDANRIQSYVPGSGCE
jgi:hypothetical protein